MDSDPRSYRVPVLRLSDVYGDEEPNGGGPEEVVTPWDRKAGLKPSPQAPAPQQPQPAVQQSSAAAKQQPRPAPQPQPQPTQQGTSVAAASVQTPPQTPPTHQAPAVAPLSPTPPEPIAATEARPDMVTGQDMPTPPHAKTPEPQAPAAPPTPAIPPQDLVISRRAEQTAPLPEPPTEATVPSPIAPRMSDTKLAKTERADEKLTLTQADVPDIWETAGAVPAPAPRAALPVDKPLDVPPPVEPAAVSGTEPPATPEPVAKQPTPEPPAPEPAAGIPAPPPIPQAAPTPAAAVPAAPEPPAPTPPTETAPSSIELSPSVSGADVVPIHVRNAQDEEAPKWTAPQPQVEISEERAAGGVFRKLLTAFGLAGHKPASTTPAAERPVEKRGLEEQQSVATEEPHDTVERPAQAPMATKPLDMWDSAAPTPLDRPDTAAPAPAAPFGEQTSAAEAEHAPPGTAEPTRAPSASEPTFYTPQELPDEGDDPLDMWGSSYRRPAALKPTPAETPVEEAVAESPVDLSETVEDLAAFEPLPNTNIEAPDEGLAEEAEVKPETGTSLATLRERVLQQSVEDALEPAAETSPTKDTELAEQDLEALRKTHGLVSGSTSIHAADKMPETAHAKAIASVAEELEHLRTGEPETPHEPEQNPNLPKVHTSLPMIRTYRGDVERAVTKDKVSMVSMISAEEKRRTTTSNGVAKRKMVKPRRSWKTYVMIGSIFAFVIATITIAGIVWYLVSVHPQATVFDNSIIGTERSIEFDVTDKDGPTVQRELAALMEDTRVGNGAVAEVLLFETTLDTVGLEITSKVTAPELFRVWGTKTPKPLIRAIDDRYVFGIHERTATAPFLILKTSYYDNALAGMFEWEETMAHGLAPLFGPYEQYERDTPSSVAPQPATTTSATSTDTSTSTAVAPAQRPVEPPPLTFTDIPIANVPARALYRTDGTIGLIWTMPDTATIIIATNEETIHELRARTGGR